MAIHPPRPERPVPSMTDEFDSRAARELLNNLVESSDDAILTKDRQGTITSWNQGAQRLYGYSAKQAIGQPVSMLEPPERAGEQQSLSAHVFAGGSFERLETERVRKDGSRVAV